MFYVLVSWLWGMWDFNSLTRDQTRTPCIGRWNLNHHRTTRKVPVLCFFLLVNDTLIWLDHILLTHLETDEHLGSFYFLAIVNNVTINIHVQVFMWTYFHVSWVYLGVELLGQMVTLYLTIWGTIKMFSKTLWFPKLFFTFSQGLKEDNNFSTYSPTLIICLWS